MKRLVITLILALVVVACGPTAEGARLIKMRCERAERLGLTVLVDLSDIGWCKVEGPLPFGVALITKSEPDVVWGIPKPPEGSGLQAQAEDRQWALNAILARAAWERGTFGAGVNVAVLDTGIAPHPDLPDIRCINFVGGQCLDVHGHGTHVTGIIAAQHNDTGIRGVAPAANVVAFKVLNDDGQGPVSAIAAGILEAVRSDADVINMSFGGVEESNVMRDAANFAIQQGVVLVAACGNSGQDPMLGDICMDPGRYDSVIGVGAVDRYLRWAFWSNRHPRLTAPGVDVNSTTNDGSYAAWSGTSMASPHVAAAAALYLEEHPGASPAEVMKAITGTTRDLSHDCDMCGTGILDVGNLLTQEPEPTPVPTDTPVAYPVPTKEATPTPRATFFPTATHTPQLTPTGFWLWCSGEPLACEEERP